MLINRPKVFELSHNLYQWQWLNWAQGKAQSHFFLAHLGNWGESLVCSHPHNMNLSQPQICPSSSFPSFFHPCHFQWAAHANKSQDRPGPFPALINPRILSGGSSQQQVDHRKGYCQNIPFSIVWGSSTAQSHTKAAGWEDDSTRWKAVLLRCVTGSTSSRISTSTVTQGIFKDICLSQPCATIWLPEKPRRAPKHNISQRVTVRAVVSWN